MALSVWRRPGRPTYPLPHQESVYASRMQKNAIPPHSPIPSPRTVDVKVQGCGGEGVEDWREGGASLPLPSRILSPCGFLEGPRTGLCRAEGPRRRSPPKVPEAERRGKRSGEPEVLGAKRGGEEGSGVGTPSRAPDFCMLLTECS